MAQLRVHEYDWRPASYGWRRNGTRLICFFLKKKSKLNPKLPSLLTSCFFWLEEKRYWFDMRVLLPLCVCVRAWCTWVCLSVCLSVCLCLCVSVSVCVLLRLCPCLCAYIHTNTLFVCVSICMHECAHMLSTYLCMNSIEYISKARALVCIHIYISIHTYIHTYIHAYIRM